MQSDYWKDQRVVITGGSSGLGLALAIALAQLGARVVSVARSRPSEFSEPNVKVHFIQGDVSKKEDIYQIAGEAVGILGGIDVLINNASYLGVTPLRLLMDTDCEDLEMALSTNVVGPFRLTKALLPSMILQNSGTVLNISSDAAVSAYPNWGSYSVSKAALDHLTRIWQEELAGKGIRFFAVDPGDMNTPMHYAAIPDANPADLHNPQEVATGLIQLLQTPTQIDTVRHSAREWREQIAEEDNHANISSSNNEYATP